MVKVGDRIQFISHGAPDPAPLTEGDTGTVVFIDDGGTVHTKWDSGRTLGLIPGVDRWHVMIGEETT